MATSGSKKPTAKSGGVVAKRPRINSTHPPTSEMVCNAIKNLNERGGSSLQAIKKYMSTNYEIDAQKLAPFIKKYVKNAVTNGSLIQKTGKGATGSYKLPPSSNKKKAGVATTVVSNKTVAAKKGKGGSSSDKKDKKNKTSAVILKKNPTSSSSTKKATIGSANEKKVKPEKSTGVVTSKSAAAPKQKSTKATAINKPKKQSAPKKPVTVQKNMTIWAKSAGEARRLAAEAIRKRLL